MWKPILHFLQMLFSSGDILINQANISMFYIRKYRTNTLYNNMYTVSTIIYIRVCRTLELLHKLAIRYLGLFSICMLRQKPEMIYFGVYFQCCIHRLHFKHLFIVVRILVSGVMWLIIQFLTSLNSQ